MSETGMQHRESAMRAFASDMLERALGELLQRW
jgi:hypothetical protein